MEEKEAVRLLRLDDIKAFETLLFAYERRIFSYLLRLSGNREDAADLTQETFLKLYKNRRSADPEGNFKSWLYTIATHTAYDWMRKKQGKVMLALPDEDTETLADIPAYNLKEEKLDIETALSGIRDEHRAALLLFYGQGFSYVEIAAALDLPLNTVKTHIHRGKAELKKLLYGYSG